jgi:hypothetical protein
MAEYINKIDSKQIIVMLIIIALGLVVVNQTLSYFYKAKFLQTPCQLCLELNPQYDDCFMAYKGLYGYNIMNITIDISNYTNEVA